MELKTFDILLCAGNGKFSRIIQRMNKIAGYTGVEASISHVAMVLKTSEKIFGGGGATYPVMAVFESTTRNKWCGKSGVQINPYSQWLRNYDGAVYVRKVRCMPADDVAEWMASQVGRPYENGLGGLLELATAYLPMNRTRLGRWLQGKMKTIEPHCSEIDAECLQKFGLMTKNVNPSKLPPAFWYGTGLDDIMTVAVDDPILVS